MTELPRIGNNDECLAMARGYGERIATMPPYLTGEHLVTAVAVYLQRQHACNHDAVENIARTALGIPPPQLQQ